MAMTGLPEDSAAEHIRAAGRAAYRYHDWDAEVLDLVFDSVLDGPGGPADDVRRMRFAGDDCTVDIEVRGDTELTVEITVAPAGPVVVETRTPGGGARTILWTQGQAMTWIRPQLTSFLLRWPGSDRRSVRTAWVLF